MYRRIIMAVLIIMSMVTIMMDGAATVHAAYPYPSADTWAWCGVHPDAPNAQRIANNMARYAGIDATFGPCMPADWTTYSAANPGRRYVDPTTYARLTVINANAGMTTVVYDARVWSDDPAVRQEAVAFWAPFLPWVRAFDMGDEFDPYGSEWSIFVHRYYNVLNYITPQLGVGPFTNFIGNASIDKALADVPELKAHLSYDVYDIDTAVTVAHWYDWQVNHLMCAVNALPMPGILNPTYRTVRSDMKALRNAGCDSFLIFGGVSPYWGYDLARDPWFGDSLVRYNGSITMLATAVLYGAR